MFIEEFFVVHVYTKQPNWWRAFQKHPILHIICSCSGCFQPVRSPSQAF